MVHFLCICSASCFWRSELRQPNRSAIRLSWFSTKCQRNVGQLVLENWKKSSKWFDLLVGGINTQIPVFGPVTVLEVLNRTENHTSFHIFKKNPIPNPLWPQMLFFMLVFPPSLLLLLAASKNASRHHFMMQLTCRRQIPAVRRRAEQQANEPCECEAGWPGINGT